MFVLLAYLYFAIDFRHEFNLTLSYEFFFQAGQRSHEND